jgi:predicted metal-dependent phosphoesterase TrpH
MPVSIDLHLHTTASDGQCAPEQLVRLASDAGIRVLSVTDHDTRAGHAAAAAAAATFGLTFIPGIEITAVYEGRDVHVLAYGLPEDAPALETRLRAQRRLRVERAMTIAERLAECGAAIDIDELVALAGSGGKAIARPQIAKMLVTAGHAASIGEAFERYLGEHCRAYVAHSGASPLEVVSLVGALNGVSSLAHPGRLNRDELIGPLVDAGLDCIEAYHSSHDLETETRYLAVARHHGLAVTGGSDYHGETARGAEHFGKVGLPLDRFREFAAIVAVRVAARGDIEAELTTRPAVATFVKRR